MGRSVQVISVESALSGRRCLQSCSTQCSASGCDPFCAGLGQLEGTFSQVLLEDRVSFYWHTVLSMHSTWQNSSDTEGW